MAKTLFVVVGSLVAMTITVWGQSKPSIQGVWRLSEVTITDPNPAPGTLAMGTHTNIQPGLMIVSAKHYCLASDTAAKPRPTTPFKVPAKPTAEEMQSQWGPFASNCGTYEVSGNTLTRHPIVAKNPANQGGKAFTRYTIKIDGGNLWVTPMESGRGKAANPATLKYVRVE